VFLLAGHQPCRVKVLGMGENLDLFSFFEQNLSGQVHTNQKWSALVAGTTNKRGF